MAKVGMRVKMSESGKMRFKDSVTNPHQGIGVVTKAWEISDVFDLNLKVRWESGWNNSYAESDLELVLTEFALEDYV